jgi:hypothetical protein
MFMPLHLSAGPRVAHKIKQEADRNFQNIEHALKKPDAAAARASLPHPHTQFADPEPRAAQQQNHFRLRIIFRVPMGECENDSPVGRPKSAGAVGHVHSNQHANDLAQHQASKFANQGLFIARFGQEARADDQIDVLTAQVLHQAAHFGRAVLAIPIHLHRHVISVEGGVAIPCLHCAPDSQIEREA